MGGPQHDFQRLVNSLSLLQSKVPSWKSCSQIPVWSKNSFGATNFMLEIFKGFKIQTPLSLSDKLRGVCILKPLKISNIKFVAPNEFFDHTGICEHDFQEGNFVCNNESEFTKRWKSCCGPPIMRWSLRNCGTIIQKTTDAQYWPANSTKKRLKFAFALCLRSQS